MINRNQSRRKHRQNQLAQAFYLLNLPEVDINSSSSTLNSSSSESSSTCSSSTNYSSESEQTNRTISSNIFSKQYSDVLFSTLLSKAGLCLNSCELVINLFNCWSLRFSKDPVLLPSVRYYWQKKAKALDVNVYIICANQHSHGPYIGEPKLFEKYHCDGMDYPADLKSGRYFLHLPLKNQLEKILPVLPSHCWLEFDSENFDIFNSVQAKKVKNCSVSNDVLKITLTLHADEISVGKSSSEKIFPIFVSLNELKAEHRRKFFLLIGLFIGRKKPPVEIFLGPLCEELQYLSKNPVEWIEPDSQEEKKATFHLICLIADAPMRSYLRNVRQFNHKKGCDWCLIQATTVQRARFYPNLKWEEVERIRRDKNHFMDFSNLLTQENDQEAIQMLMSDHFSGIKGISPLLILEDFDIVNGIAVEPMHSISLGVFRNIIMRGFLSSEHSDIYEKNFDLTKFKNEFGSRLKSIAVPSEFTRIPRDFHQIKHWKSSEYDSFLVYFFFPAVRGLIKSKPLKHILTLSRLYYLCHVGGVENSNLQEVRNLVEEFQQSCLSIYGESFLSYNLHILSHLADSIYHLGPNANTSSYPLEDQMGKLKKKVHRFSHIAPSLVRFFMADFAYKEYKIQFLEKWNLTNTEKKYFSCDSDGLLTSIPDKNLTRAEKETISRKFFSEIATQEPFDPKKLNFLKTVKFSGKRYSTERYGIDKIRDDSKIKTKDGKFYKIGYIIDYNGILFFCCYEYKKQLIKIENKGITGTYSFKLENIHEVVKMFDEHIFIRADNVSSKFILVKSTSFSPYYKYDHIVELFLQNK